MPRPLFTHGNQNHDPGGCVVIDTLREKKRYNKQNNKKNEQMKSQLYFSPVVEFSKRFLIGWMEKVRKGKINKSLEEKKRMTKIIKENKLQWNK